MPDEDLVPFNDDLLEALRAAGGVGLAGSLYAVPEAQRAAAADLLSLRGLWIHADVFADTDMGVSLDLITRLADERTGPVDVHLLTHETLDALDVVCRPGVARVTFPFERTDDVGAVAARVRVAGAQPWLAISPGTALDECRGVLAHVDGLLVMLIEPGTRESADLSNLAKVNTVRTQRTAGVDGGVNEENLPQILAAGTGYVVVGRRLFTCSNSKQQGVLR